MQVALIATSILFMVAAIACKKDDKKAPPTNTEVLIEANNNKALGKYSGVLIGSSGYFSVELRTSGSTATVRFDGTTYTMNGQAAVEDGKAVTNYVFQKDAVKLTFSVGADGKSPTVKIDIPGHKVYAAINKETTTYKTESFIGKIRDSSRRRDITPVALTISNNNISGYMKLDTQYFSLSGKMLEAGKLTVTSPYAPGKTLEATLSNNKVSGGAMYTFDLSKTN